MFISDFTNDYRCKRSRILLLIPCARFRLSLSLNFEANSVLPRRPVLNASPAVNFPLLLIIVAAPVIIGACVIIGAP